MKKLLVVFVLCLFVFSSASSFAADSKYPAGPIQKLERGVGNTAFGWSEIPKRIVDETKASNPVKGLIWGTLQGTGKAFARTASGVSEVVTFPLGKYDKPKVLPDMATEK
ncbi:MAG: exosortase system-associated protein, TIGR04073 family [Candidatus Omnitrophica bacterium]|nr:exosortase system-associated protein, TIGR04073 family [Candidatus Omnitrophota bacterium]